MSTFYGSVHPAGALFLEKLPLDVVIHVHQVADAAHIVGDVGVAVDGVLDGTACNGEVDHIHGFVVVQHGVDQAAGKGIAAADTVEDVKGEQLALEGVTLVPHKGFQAVLAAAVGVADMAGNALEVGIPLDETLEDLILLLVAGLQGHTVFPIALGMVGFVLPQVVRLNAQQDIDVGQALGAEITGFLPAPQGAAEVAVEADGQTLPLGDFEHIEDQAAAVGSQSRGDAAQVQPVETVQQAVQIHLREIVLGDDAVLAVIDDFGGADAVAGLQIIGTQTVGRGLVRLGQDHRGAVDVVGAQPAHRAFAKAVVRHDAEEGAVHTKVGQCEGDVGLAAAVACLKARCHSDLFVVRRGQTEHDLTTGDEFLPGVLVAKDRVEMFHNDPPKRRFGIQRASCENRGAVHGKLPLCAHCCIHYSAFLSGLQGIANGGKRKSGRNFVQLVKTAAVTHRSGRNWGCILPSRCFSAAYIRRSAPCPWHS